MTPDKVFNLLGAIVTVALITVIVSNRNTSNVISASGNAFAGSLRAAMGK